MTETVRISQSPPDRTSLNYAALRESGMELIRSLAGDTWTDHNVHDPGITLLEACCYAMTELGFRIQLDVADLLRTGEAHAPNGLIPAHRVLPCGPVTPEDLRKLLLDHPLLGNARITTGVDGAVRFYEDVASDPPFTYVPNGGRVRLDGLFEVMLELQERELNSNTYTEAVASAGETYTLDFALPHWDEQEAAPFREAGAISIDSVQMVDPGSGVWRALEEPQTYFGEFRVDYTGPGGPDSVESWVLLRITDDLEQAALVTPGILAEARVAVETAGASGLAGRFAERVRSAFSAVRQVERYVSLRRNLGEDLERLAVSRVQEIAIRARIEVTEGAGLERLLAEIFLAIDCELSPPIQFLSLDQARSQRRGVEQIFDGPLLRHGVLDEEAGGLARAALLFTSDILRLIMRLRREGSGDIVAQENPAGRDIIAITDLALSNFVNNRSITVDAQDCLRLVDIERYRPRLSLAKSRIVFMRDDVELDYDAARVEQLFAEMQEQKRAKSMPNDFSPVWPVPGGESLPVEEYFSFQNDLPRLYGVGEAGLPQGAGVERRAQALQTKGYLLFFDQLLADLTAQLGHVNRFFSPDPNEGVTYFTRPLFDVPGVDSLLTRFAGGDWAAFVNDPENPHRQALREAAESRDRFLDRRNRMLDHLLARLGEETVAWSQELHRWGRNELDEASLLPADLAEAVRERRRAVNARLVLDKAALLFDLPELSANRLQALGNLAWGQRQHLGTEETGGEYRWVLGPGGAPALRSSELFNHEASAIIAGEEAELLAAQPDYYEVVPDGPAFRYRLKDDSSGAARVVGESAQSFPSIASAESALESVAAILAGLRLDRSLSPMERRINHLTGIRSRQRRRLAVPLASFIEIFDEADADSIIEKRWRLWELPGQSGAVLLSSPSHFVGSTDAEAISLALEAIRQMLRYGMDEWNYRVSLAGPATFNFALHDPSGNQLGVRMTPFPSAGAARAAMAAAIAHLYRLYSAEGFHLVEHVLLRPRQTGDPFLSLPLTEAEKERDPYSQRLSLIWPTGYERDFSAGAGAARTEAPPHRFRDPEFRRHAERTVRQSCPAHLLPDIYWVDRQAPGTPDSAASFEGFEARFFDWLETVLIPGPAPAAAQTARAALIESLNLIASANAG